MQVGLSAMQRHDGVGAEQGLRGDGAGTWQGGAQAVHGSPARCVWHRDTCPCGVLQDFIPRERLHKSQRVTYRRKAGSSAWGGSGRARHPVLPSGLTPIPQEGPGAASASRAHPLSRLPEGGPKKLRSNIRRSTETGIAVEMRTRVTRQGSRESTDGSTNSNSSDGT